MRASTWLVALSGVFTFLAVEAGVAQTTSSTATHPNSQQEKMKTCNADASSKGLTGADRSTYMKTCLSSKGASSSGKTNSQQEKMKTCNAEASSKSLTGNDRKAFMKTCLSGSSG